MDFYLKDKSARFIHFPLNPPKLEVKTGANLQSFNIVQLGEVKIPRGNLLTGVSWDGILPGESKKNMPYVKNWHDPEEIVSILENYKDNGEKLGLLITETSINLDVYIEAFEYSWLGGFGDVHYRLGLVKARELKIYSSAEWKENKSSVTTTKTTRSSSPPPKTYTVKSGDNLYGIAKKLLGNGRRFKEIYYLNRDIVGPDYNLIIPGQVLRIPGGEVDQ